MKWGLGLIWLAGVPGFAVAAVKAWEAFAEAELSIAVCLVLACSLMILHLIAKAFGLDHD